MDAQELRNLQEAYMEVVENQQLDELSVNRMNAYVNKAEKDRNRLNKKWDQGTATSKERKKVFDREEGEARAVKKIKQKTGKYPHQLNAIDRLKAAVKKEQVDIYDIILSHLLDEGYKPPRGKMTKRVAHKMLKGVNTLKKAHDAGENLDPKGGTAGGQIAGQKSEKLGRQAQKIYQTAKRHNPEASKEKERQNRAVGDTAREVGPSAAAALRDRFKKTGPRPNTPKKKNNYGKAIRDGIIDGINDALGEQYDIYDIILSHLLDEGYAETPEAAEAIMVNMSEDWRQSIIG